VIDHVPLRLSHENAFVYKVWRKKIEMAHRVSASSMAIGLQKNQSICEREPCGWEGDYGRTKSVLSSSARVAVHIC
jgi:hypothetical protein